MGQVDSKDQPSGDQKTGETYQQLVWDVAEANRIASNYSDAMGRKLLYRLEPQSEEDITIPMFWKHFVSVWVKKVPSTTRPSPTFELDIKQFYRMFHYMKEISADGTAKPLSPKPPREEEEGQGGSEEEEDDNECTICMERKACVLLDCTHAFCDVCLEKWNEKNDTCPMCRMVRQTTSSPKFAPKSRTLSSSSSKRSSTAGDWWIISEDTSQDMASYFDEFLWKMLS